MRLYSYLAVLGLMAIGLATAQARAESLEPSAVAAADLSHGAKATFDEAVNAYRVGDLESAHALFSELYAEGLTPEDRAIVLYDLGNIAFRRERFLEAVAEYTAATRAAPPSADLWHNLELARARAGLDPADAGDLAATLRRVLALPSDGELWGAGWALVVLFALVLLFEIWRGGTAPKVIALLVALVFAGDLALLQHRAASALESPGMVIATGGAPLHSEPNPERTLGITLEPATLVEIVDSLGEAGRPGAWVKVEAPAGTGWLDESEVLSW